MSGPVSRAIPREPFINTIPSQDELRSNEYTQAFYFNRPIVTREAKDYCTSRMNQCLRSFKVVTDGLADGEIIADFFSISPVGIVFYEHSDAFCFLLASEHSLGFDRISHRLPTYSGTVAVLQCSGGSCSWKPKIIKTGTNRCILATIEEGGFLSIKDATHTCPAAARVRNQVPNLINARLAQPGINEAADDGVNAGPEQPGRVDQQLPPPLAPGGQEAVAGQVPPPARGVQAVVIARVPAPAPAPLVKEVVAAELPPPPPARVVDGQGIAAPLPPIQGEGVNEEVAPAIVLPGEQEPIIAANILQNPAPVEEEELYPN